MAKIIITLEDVEAPESTTRISAQANFNPPLPQDWEPDRPCTTAEIIAFRMLEVLEGGATHVEPKENKNAGPAN